MNDSRFAVSRAWRATVLAAALLAAVWTGGAETNAVPAAAAGKAAVRPEQWTRDFPAVLEQARATHRPVLMITGKRGCTYCKRMKDVLSSASFQKWVEGSGVYLAEARFDETNASPAQAQLVQFLLATPHDDSLTFPYLGVYWPRKDKDAVRSVFTWRRGRMPGESHPTLTGEFVNAMDVVLGDYLKTLPNRPSRDEILACTVKHVKGACEGGGTVSLDPPSGELDVEGRVVLTVHPPKGSVLAGWRAPDGKLLPKGKVHNKLTVSSTMAGGTYTAVLKKLK